MGDLKLWISALAFSWILLSTMACATGPDEEVVNKRVAALRQAESLELRTGVIVDFKKKRIFLMNAEKTIEAVDIDSGKKLWSSAVAAMPLAVRDGLLVAQADAAKPGNTLDLVVLQAQDGRQVSKSSVALPARVRTHIDDGILSKFSTRAVTIGDESFVSWEHRARPARGMPPLPDEDGKPMEAAQPRTAGTVRLNVRSGKASLIEPTDVPQAVHDVRPMNLTGPRESHRIRRNEFRSTVVTRSRASSSATTACGTSISGRLSTTRQARRSVA